jgi:hypothetical protein
MAASMSKFSSRIATVRSHGGSTGVKREASDSTSKKSTEPSPGSGASEILSPRPRRSTKRGKIAAKRNLVLVRWGDAWVHGAWDDESNSAGKATPVIVHTVGWVISDTPDGILVAAQIAGIDQLANQSFIPRGMIHDVTTIKRGELTSE